MGGSRVMLVAGTRPELIKLWPVETAIRRHGRLRPILVTTGQQPVLIAEALSDLDLEPADRLPVERLTGTLPEFAAAATGPLERAIRRHAPDVVVVQGDTISAFLGGLVAFWSGVPVVHLEAGLRSGVRRVAFPEEAQRRMLSLMAALHLAPTAADRDRLVAEGVAPETVLVTGNTVVDTLLHRPPGTLPRLTGGFEKVVLVTLHRRESWGGPARQVLTAVHRLAGAFPDVLFAVQTHPNGALVPDGTSPNVTVVPPLPHSAFVALLRTCALVLTDSGGVQEEATSLGVPLVVLREGTERGSGRAGGSVVIAGTGTDAVVGSATALLSAPPSPGTPGDAYGDGRAGDRAEAALAWFLGQAAGPPEEFGG
jgi:UDP-N-acetylglucosamine 2-epimerase (non-hydrolysing)